MLASVPRPFLPKVLLHVVSNAHVSHLVSFVVGSSKPTCEMTSALVFFFVSHVRALTHICTERAGLKARIPQAAMAESLARPLPVLALALEIVRLLTIVVVLVAGVVTLVSACAQTTEIDRLLTVTVVVVDDVERARLLTSAVLVTLSLNVRSAALPLCLLACALVRVFLGWTPFASGSLAMLGSASRSARPPRQTAGRLSSAADGSLDVRQVWLHWGRMNLSCNQPLQHITEHAFGSWWPSSLFASKRLRWPDVGHSGRVYAPFSSTPPTTSACRVSPEPVCVSVVTVPSFADGCDAHTFEDGMDGAPVCALDCHIESRVFADTKHLSESSDIVPPLVEHASTVPDVTMGRDSLHADTPALVSEPDCFPPTLPDCKSEPFDDELPLAPVSPFSSVKLECDPELTLPRPHSDSVDPVPGLLPVFSFCLQKPTILDVRLWTHRSACRRNWIRSTTPRRSLSRLWTLQRASLQILRSSRWRLQLNTIILTIHLAQVSPCLPPLLDLTSPQWFPPAPRTRPSFLHVGNPNLPTSPQWFLKVLRARTLVVSLFSPLRPPLTTMSSLVFLPFSACRPHLSTPPLSSVTVTPKGTLAL